MVAGPQVHYGSEVVPCNFPVVRGILFWEFLLETSLQLVSPGLPKIFTRQHQLPTLNPSCFKYGEWVLILVLEPNRYTDASLEQRERANFLDDSIDPLIILYYVRQSFPLLFKPVSVGIFCFLKLKVSFRDEREQTWKDLGECCLGHRLG